jgi:hypothetical protein
MSSPVKYVYAFGAALTEGEAAMKNLLGGKGANLAEMCRLGHHRSAGVHDQHRSLHGIHRQGAGARFRTDPR